jgi:hypothetical protein
MARQVTTGPTAWVGWAYFAAAMLLVVGGMHVISGLVGIFRDKFYVVGENALVAFNFSTWGWIQLVIGVLAILTAFGIMAGSLWARVIGVLVAALAIIENAAFLNEYPIWSVMAMIVCGFVIYALTMHGAELRD